MLSLRAKFKNANFFLLISSASTSVDNTVSADTKWASTA